MTVNIDPPRGPPPGVAQVLAEAALQRQSALLGTDRESASSARSPGVPAPVIPPQAPVAPVPPLPVGADQVQLSPQARARLAEAPAAPSGGSASGQGAAIPATASSMRGAPLLAAGPGRLPPTPATAGATPLPPWPATGVGAPLRSMLAELVRQVTTPAQQPQRVLAVQPWPAVLAPVVEGAALGEDGLPGLPPLQNWLVRQGVVQTPEGERAFSLTLRVPVPWLQAQAQTAIAPAPTPAMPSLAALFAGKPQALQSGTWALVLQSTEPASVRTSALLTLEFAPLVQPPVYGRELLHARQDPWLQMAVLQASGQLPKDEDAAREREAGLCQTPGCPYAARASCAQPFCMALRVVQPSGPVEPMPPL